MNDRQIHEALQTRQLELMGRLRPFREPYLARLQEGVHPGYRFPWRVAEAPALVPRALFERDVAAVEALVSAFFTAEFRAGFRRFVPQHYRRADGGGWFPRFVSADFQRVWDPRSESFTWCFPEVQSFPANLLLKPHMLLAFLPWMPERGEADLFPDPRIKSFADYLAVLRDIVVGDEDPGATAIVDLAPAKQSTVVDMLLFVKHLGVRLVGLEDLEIDPQSGRVGTRRSIDWKSGGPETRTFARPIEIRRILCRAIPEEMEGALRDGGLDAGRLERLFQGTTAAGSVHWVVHPQDFFVISKASLSENPRQHPRLRPLTRALVREICASAGGAGSGVVKPAQAAGGRGLLGIESRPRAEQLRELARALDRARATHPDPGDHLEHLHLWQERYGADPFPRERIPGYAPAGPEERDPIYHELRLLMSTTTEADGAVGLRQLTGLTRWSRLGDPANARHQKTPFTGTQGILLD